MVPKMNIDESITMTLNYCFIYGQPVTKEIAEYIVHITNNVPGRIVELLTPNMNKPLIKTIEDADRALDFEVDQGNIKKDWFLDNTGRIYRYFPRNRVMCRQVAMKCMRF
jgi:hypothetical protein